MKRYDITVEDRTITIKESTEGCFVSYEEAAAELAKRDARIKELEGMLKVADCPYVHCYTHDESPCQWCCERDSLINSPV